MSWKFPFCRLSNRIRLSRAGKPALLRPRLPWVALFGHGTSKRLGDGTAFWHWRFETTKMRPPERFDTSGRMTTENVGERLVVEPPLLARDFLDRDIPSIRNLREICKITFYFNKL